MKVGTSGNRCLFLCRKEYGKMRRELQTIPNVNLNEVFSLTEIQAKTRYNIGRNRLIEIANEAGAIIKLGERKNGYLREVLDDYFRMKAE